MKTIITMITNLMITVITIIITIIIKLVTTIMIINFNLNDNNRLS